MILSISAMVEILWAITSRVARGNSSSTMPLTRFSRYLSILLVASSRTTQPGPVRNEPAYRNESLLTFGEIEAVFGDLLGSTLVGEPLQEPIDGRIESLLRVEENFLDGTGKDEDVLRDDAEGPSDSFQSIIGDGASAEGVPPRLGR